MVRAALELDILDKSGDTDDNLDDLIDDARERYGAIETAILAINPDDLGDRDLVAMLDLAREIIGNDDYTTEQEERADEMLDLIRLALTRRTIAAELKHRPQAD